MRTATRLDLLALAFTLTACGSAGIGADTTNATSGTNASDAGTPPAPTAPADSADAGTPPVPEEPDSTDCYCAYSVDEPIELHVLARDLPRDRQDALAALLAKDGFVVLFVEYADETSDPKVAIETTPSRFVAVFRGRIEARTEAMSAQDGFSCQATVEGIVIPKRYRKFIRAIRTPDPQLY